MLKNIFKEGVDEGYGPEKLPHLWRYPWVMKRQLKKAGFEIISFEDEGLVRRWYTYKPPADKHKTRLALKSVLILREVTQRMNRPSIPSVDNSVNIYPSILWKWQRLHINPFILAMNDKIQDPISFKNRFFSFYHIPFHLFFKRIDKFKLETAYSLGFRGVKDLYQWLES